jgi:hypothetical protein
MMAVPQWRKNLAKAETDGALIEFRNEPDSSDWGLCEFTFRDYMNPNLILDERLYRIRPEPDVDVTFRVKYENTLALFTDTDFRPNLKLTFDANGNLKDAEVL